MRVNFSPARNVRSTTAPDSSAFSFVRTKAPPLPGFTCWNSTIRHTEPSTSMCIPFLNWLVLTVSATAASLVAELDQPGHAGRPVRLRPEQVAHELVALRITGTHDPLDGCLHVVVRAPQRHPRSGEQPVRTRTRLVRGADAARIHDPRAVDHAVELHVRVAADDGPLLDAREQPA